MTYNMFGGTLNFAQSINLLLSNSSNGHNMSAYVLVLYMLYRWMCGWLF